MYVCASVHVRVERGNSQNKQKMEFFQKIKSTGYTSHPSITTINLQKNNQLIKKKSLFEPIFQEDTGHGVSALLPLQLYQGITSWLVQEAKKKNLTPVSRSKRGRKKTPSPHCVLCSRQPKTSHATPLLTCPTTFT